MKGKLHYLLLPLLLLVGCRKFEDINTDPARPAETTPEFLLANAEKRATDLMYNGYYNGRIGMHFAQYWMGTDKTSEGRNFISDEGLWTYLYTGPLMDLQGISNYYERYPEKKNEQMIAVAEILKAWIFQVLTDVYVDIPYRQALQADTYPQPAFDRAEDVYQGILASLQEQVDVLQKVQAQGNVIGGDIIGKGDVHYWLRFANALRMRIALRMADVRPSEAGTIIAEAAQNTLKDTTDNIYFPYDVSSVTNRFPYNEADKPSAEFAVTTTLINYLAELQDPRLPVYARPAQATGMYRGKVYGEAGNIPTLDSLSKPGTMVYRADFRGYIITYAEVAFIKAEAAARGIPVGGSAEYWYNEAIRASMAQWGITDPAAVEGYLLRVPYHAGSWKNVIGCQKWIALYMQGLQAWMERLRLDFKKPDGTPLFIMPASGSLDPDVADVPKRLNYPAATRNSNTANCQAATQDIGGDSKATRNWWDIY